LISAAFPPTGGPGVQRSAKFAKYLPRFGWTPVVWAMPPLPGLPSDPSLVTDVSGVVVVREDADRESKGSGSRRPHNGPRAVRALLKGLLGARADHRPFPDDCAEWARQSVEPALELIAERRIDALYSTFSPASNHRLALELERRTGLPWIADFRDLWTDDYRYREDSPGVRAAHRAVQQTILETADVVVGVSEAQTAILADHVPTHRHKFITVTNGFDPDDFAGLAEHTNAGDEIRRTDGDFILSHVGRFDRWRALDAWFDGLAEFVRYLGPRQHRFVLRIVGHADAATRRRLQDTGARCEFTGYVPHGQAIREMCHATALLLSVPDGPNAETVIPAKLFEYLAAGRPLLVVGPVDGACKSIVRSCGAGVSVGFDAGWIAAALAGLFDQSMRGGAPACSHHDRLGRFDRVTLTRRLASVLDDLVPRRQPRVQEPSLDPLELVVP
jgi:glycosyltransferase involved in cell wall biosynthesis